jgi:serine/threonine-protein kinase RsbW
VEVVFRFLEPNEASKLSQAIRVAYGKSYDVRWVYDEAEVCRRLAEGTYVSCVAETPEGELLCHEGMSLSNPDDLVGHSGQAVTMPAARGQHLFTRTKQYLMDWARERGMAGMYSEATTAHPYSQRANIELGAHETGFLLGWIPASVSNDADGVVKRGRQSAALFYTKLNDGHQRPVYAPRHHRAIIGQTLDLCGLRGELSLPPLGAEPAAQTELQVEVDSDATEVRNPPPEAVAQQIVDGDSRRDP